MGKPESHVSYPFPGPGILIALSSSGWVGLLSLVSFGADTGFALAGVTVLTLLFKYSLITGLGRYTLASGTDIFSGLSTLPGPKNWAVWLVNGILYIEIFMLGFSTITVVRLWNELLGTEYPPMLVIFCVFGLLFILVALDSYWLFRKVLMYAVLFLMIGFGSLVLTMSIPIHEIAAELIPNLKTFFGLYETSVIMIGVGSGFSLLLYSVWLVSHLKGQVPAPEERGALYRRIQIDAGVGMFLLFLVSLLYFSVGYLFLYEHGLGAPEPDLTVEIILTVLDLGQSGTILLAFVCIVALFCSLLGGLYGRARVLQVTIPRSIPGFLMNRRRYVGIVLCLVISAVSSDYFVTLTLAREFLAIRLILFGFIAGVLMWIDTGLGSGYRGSPVWYVIMGIGAVGSVLIGINLGLAVG